jgi:hypothetical protein
MIDENIGNVYQAGIATKILQHMDRIRNVSDKGQARRWVMELLQNARDIAYEGKQVKVRITIDRDSVIFSHNGRPFGVKNILSIINQVSSKSSDGDSVGKFGTGFVTTFQLSEVVEVKSVLKEEGMPYKPFCIKIDRRGRDADEILSCINETMNELKSADGLDEVEDFDSSAYNTSFIYHLDSEYSRDVAMTGIRDLRENILYVMLFSERFVEIEICNELENERTIYRRASVVTEGQSGISRLCITEYDEINETEREHFILYLDNKTSDIVMAVTMEEGNIMPLSELVPRVFVDFPLIGAERFPFPVVINSRSFKTNEPRSGITLVDNENSRDARVNKELMLEAVSLYKDFVKNILDLGYGGIENLIAIPKLYEDKEISAEWVWENIYKSIYSYISSEKLLPVEDRYVSLDDPEVYLVSADDEEEIRIKELVAPLDGIIIPDRVSVWRNALSGYEISEVKILSLKRLIENAQPILKTRLDESKMEPVVWCRKLYQAGMGNQDIARMIIAGELAIFPTQYQADWAERKLVCINEVVTDGGLPEVLKDVCDLLDGLKSEEAKLNIRKKLLHSDFIDAAITEKHNMEIGADALQNLAKTVQLPGMNNVNRDEVYNYIYRRSDRKFRVISFNFYEYTYLKIWDDVWIKLVCCGPDEELYGIFRKIYGENLQEYVSLGKDIPTYVWKNSYYYILNSVVTKITECKNLSTLKETYPEIAKDCYDWLNRVIKLVEKYMPNEDRQIYPDQNGNFKLLHELYRDEIGSEELKAISENFAVSQEGGSIRIYDEYKNCRIYDRLLDKNITGSNNMLKCYNKRMVTQNINDAVSKLLATKALSEAEIGFQENCTRLLSWIQENPQDAAEYLPVYCSDEGQMKLLTPKAAVSLRKKADEYNRIMQEMGVESPEELLEMLNNGKRQMSFLDNQCTDGEQCIDEDIWYDDDTDVSYDDEYKNYAGDNKAPLIDVGRDGELYALEYVKHYIAYQGYVPTGQRENGQVTCFEKTENEVIKRAEVIYRDSDEYHQPGYDIQVRLLENDKEEKFYIEVKTHISTSGREKCLNISNEQMRIAAREKSNYCILSVRYDNKKGEAVDVKSFPNPIDMIAEGKLRVMNKKYNLMIA